MVKKQYGCMPYLAGLFFLLLYIFVGVVQNWEVVKAAAQGTGPIW